METEDITTRDDAIHWAITTLEANAQFEHAGQPVLDVIEEVETGLSPPAHDATLLVKLIARDGGEIKTVALSGAKLRAFAHSMECESHSGAEWEGLEEAEYQQMIELFTDLGELTYSLANLEQASAAQTPDASGTMR